MDVLTPALGAPPLRRFAPPMLVNAASPAAGANFSQAVDDGKWWRLLALSVRLNTSADAANRTLYVEYRDEAGVAYSRDGNPVTYPASTTDEDFFFCAFRSHGEWEVDAANIVPLMPLLLQPAHSFLIVVDNIDNTDALTRVRYIVEKFYPPVAADYEYALG